ncbi:S-adenosyl-l-methionine hydroxide adenosyltransferase family protein [Chitinophaga sp. GCM10012297]|uniref:S-adenosyl-l-methionine hydroxide adenosyltransferase family protein n=1 Tax=Chitinophaga chungangae TaxID=2821488 RepID=A0ABS3YEA9_9BACT|nr:S-adenosyl-l-methionine hydroxide adenosyltransferase family protein [Chitinophaga chungangae]MBO9153014.1 S-adenosyl-l-methionine hydroxide adenosyltransferase family protein [Chitinophaga chungangae]
MKPFNLLCVLFLLLKGTAFSQSNVLVLQTDFGLKDGAVSAMKGVAVGVSPQLKIYDLTHEIPPFNIWEAAYRLQQTAAYWPKGTVFVSVIDPGVGSERKSVVLQTKSGHYFVTPDNGTLTLVAESMGIEAMREIDETRNRLPGSSASYTFHGRDVYAYTGARLAAGVIPFDSVGTRLPDSVVRISYQEAVFKNNTVYGNIPILDVQYGNVWTNISEKTLQPLGLKFGDRLSVKIFKGGILMFTGTLPFAATFASVPEGALLAYQNSLMNLSFAINYGNLAETYNLASGPEWTVEVTKAP